MVNSARRACARYLIELGTTSVLYLAITYASRVIWHHVEGPWKPIVALIPVLPTAAMFAVILRYLRSIDELQRAIQVQALALSGGATALLAVTYGLLEGSALPRPSAWWFYITFMVGWAVATPFVRRRYQ